MSNSIEQKITDKISFYSNGNNQLGKLLSYSIGRLCLKSTKEGADWLSELNSIDVPHIVDWLKAAIINDDAWLNNVDDQNRPKKLMKFGTFEDVQKEADKAMLRANQQNSDIKLIDGDEELYMQLEGGYHLVKLLTPAALDREGAQMQHCIGGGAYDECLEEDFIFLSLRDSTGKPHATLEMKGDGVYQLQGKQNKPPNIKYIKALKPFFTQETLAINIPVEYLGYVISSEGVAYKLNDLPVNLKVNGRLDLVGTSIKSLPAGLEVSGDLDLEGTPIETLPEGLVVGGDLDLGETYIQYIPEDLKINGYLDLRETLIKSLPESLKVGGSLNLSGTPIQSLREGLKVGGSLNLSRTPIEALPEGLVVGGDLYLAETSIQSLPEGLEVGGSLDLEGTSIQSLPEGFKVGGDLYLAGTSIEYLPEGLKVGGYLSLRGSSVKSLPEELDVGDDLCIIGTPIKALPRGLKVDGEIYGFQNQIELASFSHSI